MGWEAGIEFFLPETDPVSRNGLLTTYQFSESSDRPILTHFDLAAPQNPSQILVGGELSNLLVLRVPWLSMQMGHIVLVLDTTQLKLPERSLSTDKLLFAADAEGLSASPFTMPFTGLRRRGEPLGRGERLERDGEGSI